MRIGKLGSKPRNPGGGPRLNISTGIAAPPEYEPNAARSDSAGTSGIEVSLILMDCFDGLGGPSYRKTPNFPCTHQRARICFAAPKWRGLPFNREIMGGISRFAGILAAGMAGLSGC